MIKTRARAAAQRLMPGVMADRARRYERDLRHRLGVTELAERLTRDGEAVVRSGPFAGLRYPADRLADVDAAAAKLLGTYEQELAPIFTGASAAGVGAFIDIGCADGYYAAGMAVASPTTTVHAFDLAASARELCGATARTSGVAERVLIGRRFTVGALEALPTDGALILCDIEGAELSLFDADLIRQCAKASVVIEVHEDDVPGAGAELGKRFAATHAVTVIRQADRDVDPAAVPAEWSADDRATAVAELRGPALHWLSCVPLRR